MKPFILQNKRKYNEAMIGDKELKKLVAFLKQSGWKIIKDSVSGSNDFSAQGVIYMNFYKSDVALHIEFGEEDCVFGEIDEENGINRNVGLAV